jgi:hypothetical protein
MRAAPDVAIDADSYLTICDSWDYRMSTPWTSTAGTTSSVLACGALVAVAEVTMPL